MSPVGVMVMRVARTMGMVSMCHARNVDVRSSVVVGSLIARSMRVLDASAHEATREKYNHENRANNALAGRFSHRRLHPKLLIHPQ